MCFSEDFWSRICVSHIPMLTLLIYRSPVDMVVKHQPRSQSIILYFSVFQWAWFPELSPLELLISFYPLLHMRQGGGGLGKAILAYFPSFVSFRLRKRNFTQFRELWMYLKLINLHNYMKQRVLLSELFFGDLVEMLGVKDMEKIIPLVYARWSPKKF